VSEFEFERGDGLQFEETDFDGKVRQVVQRMLREPSSLPSEYRAWLPAFIEQSNVQVPISQVVGNFITETTTGQLGGNVHGRSGTIRGGSSPFDFIQMVYDGVYGKWVSNPLSWVIQDYTGNTDTQTFYGIIASITYAPIIPYKVFRDAGLKAQWRLVIGLDNDGANTTYAKLVYETYNSSGSSTGTTESSWELTNTGTTRTIKDSGWQETPSIANDPFVLTALLGKVSGGTGTWEKGSLYQRWVSV